MIQEERRCWVCGKTVTLERHHVMDGSWRKLSERHGLTVYLCREHHTGDTGVHQNRALDLQLREYTQRRFEAVHGHEEWMRIFGRNYIDQEEVKDVSEGRRHGAEMGE